MLLVYPAIRLDVSLTTFMIAVLAVFGQLLDCFYCLSLWFAAPLGWLMGETWLERVLLWLGLSGGAILLQRVTERNHKPPPAIWNETPIPNKSLEEE